ncbi:hypothetical protein [Streptomyces sp.]
MNDETPVTSICGCGRPVRVPTHTAGELPKEPRHIGIPGEPTECPE